MYPFYFVFFLLIHTDSFSLANAPLLVMPMKPIETFKGNEREEGTAEVQRETSIRGKAHFGSVRQFQRNNVVHTHTDSNVNHQRPTVVIHFFLFMQKSTL